MSVKLLLELVLFLAAIAAGGEAPPALRKVGRAVFAPGRALRSHDHERPLGSDKSRERAAYLGVSNRDTGKSLGRSA